MTSLKHNCLLVAMLVAGAAAQAAGQAPAPKVADSQTVLFVCEHGAAKSVIAAGHFNRIAKARGLAFRAVARGTDPDADIPAGVRTGLATAGLELVVQKPVLVGSTEARQASRVITFEIALPPQAAASTKGVTNWTAVPSVSADFAVASADIKRRVEALIDELVKK